MGKDHRWELKDGQKRRLRDRRNRMKKADFLRVAHVDIVAARLAAVACLVPLAQIQLWEASL